MGLKLSKLEKRLEILENKVDKILKDIDYLKRMIEILDERTELDIPIC